MDREFYVGELLLAIALLRADAIVYPRWVPVLLLRHVASFPASTRPDWVGKFAVLLVALPMCGLGIRVMQR